MKHLRFLKGLYRHIDLVNRGRYAMYLDYPVHPKIRWGWGRPAHPVLAELMGRGRRGYAEMLGRIARFSTALKKVPLATQDDREPRWANAYMTGLDAATLYAFPTVFQPKHYLEIGSGNSTRFVRRSIRENGLRTRITSVDPAPRGRIDEVCDEIVRSGLEDTPLELFDTLEANDILMLDGSHRCFQNSDVTVAFLEILPRLRPGVIVFIHDIFLPWDYPKIWEHRLYSEQYMLAVLLLADQLRRWEIVFPGYFASVDEELAPLTADTWRQVAPSDPGVHASCFWMRVRG